MWAASWELLEPNVVLIFLFTVLYSSASSIISQHVLSGFVYVLTASSTSVGLVQGIQGAAQLLCAFPAGWAADTRRRDRTLAFAGALGLAASLLTALAFQLSEMPLVYAAFGLWGAFIAFQTSALEALFADSVPLGQRSAPFMLKHVMRNTALVLGPVTAILLLWKYGDVWTLPGLRPVLLFGCFLAAISMAVLFLFDDDVAYENRQYVLAIERELHSIERNFTVEYSDCTVPEVDETGSERDGSRNFALPPVVSSSEHSGLLRGNLTPAESSSYYVVPPLQLGLDEPLTGTDAVEDHDQLTPVLPASACCGLLDAAHVPLLLFTSDFIVGNGTGLAATFFPLFLFQEFAFSPVRVQTLCALLPLGIALLSMLAQLMSRAAGRMPVIVLARSLGALCLALMVFSQDSLAQSALFLAHGAFMQCTEPLRRSLLMDFVPKSHRARWNSLEGLTAASWAGSAVLGGVLVEAYSFRFCFAVATLVYVCGLALETLLIPLTRHAMETPASKQRPAANSYSSFATSA